MNVWDEVLTQPNTTPLHNWWTPVEALSYPERCFLRWPQVCSMGLRSGDWAGQSRSLISCSSNQILALLEVCLGLLSCWKITSSAGISESSMLCNNPPFKMAIQYVYHSASILPSSSLKTPTPFHPIQPHTISDFPPNFTVPWTSLEVSSSPFSFPHILLSIWPNSIDFSLIWPKNPLPVLHSPMLVLESEGQSPLSMKNREKGFLFLYHSL